MSQLIETNLVALDQPLGTTPEAVITQLAGRISDTGRATDTRGLVADALEREGKSATGLPGGIAIPHCRSAHVTEPTLAFARLNPKVDFGAKDGPADLVFLIAAPAGAGQEHMKLLSSLARALVRKDFVAELRSAESEYRIVELVDSVVGDKPAPASDSETAPGGGAKTPPTDKPANDPVAKPAAAQPATPAAKTNDAVKRRIVAVTACPTGIAHTYMAADSLTQTAAEQGIDLHVETQGSSSATPLDQSIIDNADAVIFATDVGVRDKHRFAGKPVIISGVKRAINEPGVMLDEALAAADDPNASVVDGDVSANRSAGSDSGDKSLGIKVRDALLTGVSYMIPFVAAGGLLIALAFAVGGYDIVDVSGDVVMDNSLTNLPDGGLKIYLGSVFHQLGALAFGFLVPALAGYIAYAIADRPGIAPGFATGAVAGMVGAGFIGGIVGGLLAGVVAYGLGRGNLPRWLQGLMPVVVIPLVTTLVAGGLMFMLLGKPLATITTNLQDWLNGMSGSSALLLGAILGLMMCFDLGGPVNKAAYVFASAGLNPDNSASLMIMAAVMASGMVPPLAMGLSTLVRPKLYSPAEQENGKAAIPLGLSFISEGAIPFAAADPLRIIPSLMAGGAVTGALVMAMDVGVSAPHGGAFVVLAMTNAGGFFLALLVGTLVSAAIVTAVKQFSSTAKSDEVPAAAATSETSATVSTTK